MDPSLLYDLRKSCLLRTKKGQTNPLVCLNPQFGANYTFTETYYSRILSHKAMLGIDHYCTTEITEEFAAGLEDFRRSFAKEKYIYNDLKKSTFPIHK
ncbi:hypothetical protein EV1_013155 [Malus domestica]